MSALQAVLRHPVGRAGRLGAHLHTRGRSLPGFDARSCRDHAKDVTLTPKLLRYANSPFFGFRRTITSVQECLVLLGDREIKRWASLRNLASLGSEKPAELVVEFAVRAKLCATLTPEAGLQAAADHCYFIGLFSLLDAFLERPFEATGSV